jgi:hypothetical protein
MNPLNLIVVMLSWTLVFCVALICLIILAGVAVGTVRGVRKWFK